MTARVSFFFLSRSGFALNRRLAKTVIHYPILVLGNSVSRLCGLEYTVRRAVFVLLNSTVHFQPRLILVRWQKEADKYDKLEIKLPLKLNIKLTTHN